MAVTQRRQTVVNSARKNAGRKRKLSPAQIKAGFGGKRRQSAIKTLRKAKRKAVKANRSGPRPVARTAHRTRSAPKAKRANLGKIISFSLPKESTVATTKRNKSRKNRPTAARRRPAKKNTGHRRRGSRRNPSMGDLSGLVTSAVFTVAGAVGTQQLTQMVLTTSNTGVMGYFGNLVTAFLLSWGVKAFMKNDRAAAAVLSGGMVQIVLRLIADYTPFGSYTSSLGMGDYLAQNWTTPQRIAYRPHSAQLMAATTNGMSGCSLYSGGGLYNAA